MDSQDKAIVSTITLIASLSAYYLAKGNHKDPVPFVMIGTFVGAWIGQLISKQFTDKSKDSNNGNSDP